MDRVFLLNIMAASFAAVGLEEFVKNFFKPKNKVWYAVIMLPLSVGCYYAVDRLPPLVIGCALTIGCVQLCYQTIIQGFKAIVERLAGKIGANEASQ